MHSEEIAPWQRQRQWQQARQLISAPGTQRRPEHARPAHASRGILSSRTVVQDSRRSLPVHTYTVEVVAPGESEGHLHRVHDDVEPFEFVDNVTRGQPCALPTNQHKHQHCPH